MAVEKAFRLILMMGVLRINLDTTDHRGTVNGQTDGRSLVESQVSTFNGSDCGNISDLSVECSISTVDMSTKNMLNNISARTNVSDDNSSMETESEVSIIDTGSISKQTSRSIEMACDFVVIPIFICLGIIGNVLSLRTLLHQKPRDAIKIYLISLSATDILVLTSGAIHFVKELFTWYNPPVGARMGVALTVPLSFFSAIVFARMSAFLTIVLSLERTIAVILPLKVKDISLNRHPWKVVIVLYIVLILFFVPNFFRFNVFLVEDESTGQPSVIVTPSKFSRSLPALYTYYGLAGQVLTVILPMVVVFVCNVITIISLRASARSRKQMMTNQKEDDNTTRLLLTISAIFLASTSPGTINGVAVKFVPTYGLFRKEHYLAIAISDIGTTCVIINSAINFVVYMFLSKNFRKAFFETWTFAQWVRQRSKRERASSPAGSNTQEPVLP